MSACTRFSIARLGTCAWFGIWLYPASLWKTGAIVFVCVFFCRYFYLNDLKKYPAVRRWLYFYRGYQTTAGFDGCTNRIITEVLHESNDSSNAASSRGLLVKMLHLDRPGIDGMVQQTKDNRRRYWRLSPRYRVLILRNTCNYHRFCWSTITSITHARAHARTHARTHTPGFSRSSVTYLIFISFLHRGWIYKSLRCHAWNEIRHRPHRKIGIFSGLPFILW